MNQSCCFTTVLYYVSNMMFCRYWFAASKRDEQKQILESLIYRQVVFLK